MGCEIREPSFAKLLAAATQASKGFRDQSENSEPWEEGKRKRWCRNRALAFPAAFLASLWVVKDGHKQAAPCNPAAIFILANTRMENRGGS